jgi:signal transduction histidine kinase/CheY-like chemotaxis protein
LGSQGNSHDRRSQFAAGPRGSPVHPRVEGLCTGLAVFGASIIAIVGLWSEAVAEHRRGLRENLIRVAEAAASVVDTELHDHIRSPEQLDSPEYLRAIAPLRDMMGRITGVKYIYTFTEDEEGIRFVLDAATPGDHDDDGVEDRADVWELYEDSDPAMKLVLGAAGELPIAVASDRPYTDKWGTFMSGFAPLLDRFGRPKGGVGIDMDAKDYFDRIGAMRRAALYGLLPAFGASACVGLIVWDQRRRVMDAHAALERQARELADQTVALERQAVELEAERHRAEAASLAKGSFVANMTHELRTPLTAILGYSEMLDRERSLDAEASQWIRTVRRSGEHLLALINDVLDYSKVEAGKMRVELIECDPRALFEDVRLLMAERASSRGLSLDVGWDAPPPARVRTDPTRLRQVLINLVGNAIKFTPSGTVRLLGSVIPGGPTGHRLIASVIDTGIGMDAEQLGRLFKPFTQADASMSRRFGGTGLGLSISRELACLLGGELTVESRPGLGSTFRVSVDAGPVRATVAQLQASPTPDPGAMVGSADSPPAQVPAGVLHGLNVLLVEDGADNRRLATHHLTKAGARVFSAENGEAALGAISQERFDVVLMDIQMPIMDGLEATRAMRKMGITTPILALTANAGNADSTQCLSAGCDDFVSKPFTRESLVGACARWARTGQRGDASQSKAA